MKAKDKKIIEILNDVLSAELTGVNQYFLHGEMCENWGYDRLHETVRKSAIDEMKHAESIIKRILYLEGIPNVQKLGKINVGETVPEQFKVDLELEKAAVGRLNDGIRACRELGDEGSADLLEDILESEEQHVNWLESQIELIRQAGEQNYLAQQIRKS